MGFLKDLSEFNLSSIEQSHISDVPVWKSNRGPLQNQTGMVSFVENMVI